MKRFIKSLLQFVFLILIDLSAYYLSLFLAVFARHNIVGLLFPNIPQFTFSLKDTASMIWIPLIFITMFFFQRLYIYRYPFWEEVQNIFKTTTLAILIVFFTIYIRGMFGSKQVLRLVLALLWLFSIFMFPFFRFWGKKILYRLHIWRENVIILGSGESAIATVKGLIREEHLGYRVIGFLDDDTNKKGKMIEVGGKQYKVLGELQNFIDLVRSHNIRTVFIAKPYHDEEKLAHLINTVYRYVRRIILIPDITGVSVYNSELHYLFTERLFMIKVRNNLNSITNIAVKRIFDILVSLVLFILLLPILVIISLLVKLTSRGSIFYRHQRVGKDGKLFKALKFRTMYEDADARLQHILNNDIQARKEWEANYKLKNDPRITPLGRFLRRTSLDELPQIFNILKGDMSLVGPRPVIQQEIDVHYADYKDYYYSVKPGLTGLWQVSGRSDTNYEFRVQTDVWYVQNWNLWLDIIILFRTPLAVIKGRGAY